MMNLLGSTFTNILWETPANLAQSLGEYGLSEIHQVGNIKGRHIVILLLKLNAEPDLVYVTSKPFHPMAMEQHKHKGTNGFQIWKQQFEIKLVTKMNLIFPFPNLERDVLQN